MNRKWIKRIEGVMVEIAPSRDDPAIAHVRLKDDPTASYVLAVHLADNYSNFSIQVDGAIRQIVNVGRERNLTGGWHAETSTHPGALEWSLEKYARANDFAMVADDRQPDNKGCYKVVSPEAEGGSWKDLDMAWKTWLIAFCNNRDLPRNDEAVNKLIMDVRKTFGARLFWGTTHETLDFAVTHESKHHGFYGDKGDYWAEMLYEVGNEE